MEYIADWSRGAPVLVLCVARPELLDLRPGWAGGKANAATMLLEPMGPDSIHTLLAHLLGEQTVLPAALLRRITDTAGGNPLFVEEMVAMLVDDGVLHLDDGEWRFSGTSDSVTVPGSIHALLAARLDALPAGERRVTERAAVVGEVFERAAVFELSPVAERGQLMSQLLGLVRKELLRPERTESIVGDAFRFRHLLLRDAAYAALSKQERAELHGRFADWLERVRGDRLGEVEEIIAYHLANASQFRRELGDGETAQRLARRAAPHLLTAGTSAYGRDDLQASVKLLTGAAELAADDSEVRLRAQTLLGYVQIQLADFAIADEVLREAIALADAIGNAVGAAHARVLHLHVRHHVAPEVWVEEARAVVPAAVEVFTVAGDDLGLARAWHALSTAEQYDPAKGGEATARSLAHARRSGDRRELRDALDSFAITLINFDTPVRQALESLGSAYEGIVELDRGANADWALKVAMVEAMDGRFDAASRRCANAITTLQEMGMRLDLAFGATAAALAHTYMDEPGISERYLRAGMEVLSASGDREVSTYLAGRLAQALAAQDRFDEADVMVQRARSQKTGDPLAEANWRCAQARIDAARGEFDVALEHAERALALTNRRALNRYALTLVDKAFVLTRAGRHEEARATLDEARGIADQKGNIALVRIIDREIAALRHCR